MTREIRQAPFEYRFHAFLEVFCHSRASTKMSIFAPSCWRPKARLFCAGANFDDGSTLIAQNEMVLRAIQEQQLAAVERLRDPTEIALTKRDNRVKLMKARSKQARRAEKQITRLLPKVLEKYRDQLGPDPYCDSTFDLVPLDLKVLLEEPDPLEEQRARDLARKQIEQ
jgi:hypothetical protein